MYQYGANKVYILAQIYRKYTGVHQWRYRGTPVKKYYIINRGTPVKSAGYASEEIK